jgi:hypothetical protein
MQQTGRYSGGMYGLSGLDFTSKRRAGDRGYEGLLRESIGAGLALLIAKHHVTGASGGSRGSDRTHPPSRVSWRASEERAEQRLHTA